MDVLAQPSRGGAFRILAIDPGTERSAWIVTDDGAIAGHGLDANEDVLQRLRYGWPQDASVVVIESIESYGMAVGREVFETVHWSGRFTEAARPMPVVQLTRRKVKVAICGNPKAKDQNIRLALLERFGGQAAKGTKAQPGPLYGIANDVWAALAVAVTYADSQAAA
jgi:hypothetical protein